MENENKLNQSQEELDQFSFEELKDFMMLLDNLETERVDESKPDDEDENEEFDLFDVW